MAEEGRKGSPKDAAPPNSGIWWRGERFRGNLSRTGDWDVPARWGSPFLPIEADQAGAFSRAALQELIEQVAVGPVDLDAVESSAPGILRAAAEIDDV